MRFCFAAKNVAFFFYNNNEKSHLVCSRTANNYHIRVCVCVFFLFGLTHRDFYGELRQIMQQQQQQLEHLNSHENLCVCICTHSSLSSAKSGQAHQHMPAMCVRMWIIDHYIDAFLMCVRAKDKTRHKQCSIIEEWSEWLKRMSQKKIRRKLAE